MQLTYVTCPTEASKSHSPTRNAASRARSVQAATTVREGGDGRRDKPPVVHIACGCSTTRHVPQLYIHRLCYSFTRYANVFLTDHDEGHRNNRFPRIPPPAPRQSQRRALPACIGSAIAAPYDSHVYPTGTQNLVFWYTPISHTLLTILNKVEIMRAILLFNNQCRCDQHMD